MIGKNRQGPWAPEVSYTCDPARPTLSKACVMPQFAAEWRSHAPMFRRTPFLEFCRQTDFLVSVTPILHYLTVEPSFDMLSNYCTFHLAHSAPLNNSSSDFHQPVLVLYLQPQHFNTSTPQHITTLAIPTLPASNSHLNTPTPSTFDFPQKTPSLPPININTLTSTPQHTNTSTPST